MIQGTSTRDKFMHCPNSNLILCIKTEPVPDGVDATVNV